MRLRAVDRYLVPATDTVLRELEDAGGAIIGQPGLFYRQLSQHLGIDTRCLAAAVDRLWRAGTIEKLYSGTNHFFVVGICLPGRSFRDEEVSHLEDYEIG